ncbi:MAG: Unknown protein [uncultured Sulfurovum sp.]|uniref:Uncharacterized protein n=1 Tax=uncultured Sulfurovum sp. TaxID=269237 RepID=A0A6S6TVR4_9BACT|nr:MAG: Unknown protein [uncultured Sulfurovum sp.]
MIKKGLFVLLIFLINGCVGTMRLAEENSVNPKDSTAPALTKSGTSKTKD